MSKGPDINFPAPVDPTQAINQQGESNVEAAIATQLLNQINQIGPGGSTTFSQVPGGGQLVGGQFIPQFQQEVTLNPAAQAQFEAQQQLGGNLTDLAAFNVQQVADVQSTPFSTQGLPEFVSGINAPQVVNPFAAGTPIQNQIAQSGAIQSGLAGPQLGAGIETSLNTFAPQQQAPGDFQFAPILTGTLQGPSPTTTGDINLNPTLPGGTDFSGIDLSGITGALSGLDISSLGQLGPNFSIDGFNPPPGLQGLGLTQTTQAGGPDFSNLGPLQTDVGAQGGALAQEQFNLVSQLLQPDFSQQLEQANAQAVLQGLPLGSEASNLILNPVLQSQNQALTQAALGASQAGQQLQQQQFGQNLATGQFGLQAGATGAQLGLATGQQAFGQQQAVAQQAQGVQQQQFEQALAGGQFAQNQAQALFGQELAGQQLGLGAQQQAFGQAQDVIAAQGGAAQNLFNQQLATEQLGLGAQQQAFGQQLAGGQFGLGAQAQQFGQGLQGAQFGANLQGQQFGQALAGGQFVNQAQQQQFGQNVIATDIANQAQQQQFGQNLDFAAATNLAQGQAFNQAGANAALQNQARQQAFQEQAFLRSLPINEIAALLGTAPGVQIPQFAQAPQVGVAAPDIIGATLGAQQGNLGIAQAQQQASSSALGGLFGLAGSLGSAGIKAGIFSDRRLKRNIKRVGKLFGFDAFEYSYIWDNIKHLGVMAQDVIKTMPEAITEIGGFMAVDYGVLANGSSD